MTDPKATKPKLQRHHIALIIGGVTIAVVLKSCVGGNDATEVTVQAPRPAEAPSVNINTISTRDSDAALVAFGKQIEVLRTDLANSQKKSADLLAEQDRKIMSVEQNLNRQIRSVTEELGAQLKQQIVDGYQQAVKADQGQPLPTPVSPGEIATAVKDRAPQPEPLSIDGMVFDVPSLPQPLPPSQRVSVKPPSPYGPNYHILRPETVAANGSSGGGSVQRDARAELSSLAGPSGGREATGPAPVSVATTDEPARPRRTAASSQQPVAPASQPVAYPDPPPTPQPTVYEQEVPAFSYVEVTTLHGVNCPVGANQPGASGEGNALAKPVVLPARGIFRGPNGAEHDLGTVHFMGLCSGNRIDSSTTGRATIRVERISYWDEGGKPQYESALGYIVDTRDNQMDVYGRLIKVSGRQLAKESFAAGLAAVATGFSQAEYSTNSSMDGGDVRVTQMLTGNQINAAVAQGIGALFGRIADRFEAEADSVKDSVLVEPGIRLKFITEQPLKIKRTAPAVDINAELYDVII